MPPGSQYANTLFLCSDPPIPSIAENIAVGTAVSLNWAQYPVSVQCTRSLYQIPGYRGKF